MVKMGMRPKSKSSGPVKRKMKTERETAERPSTRIKGQPQIKKEMPKMGDKVSIKWEKDWCDGTVTDIINEQSFDVTYEDGSSSAVSLLNS